VKEWSACLHDLFVMRVNTGADAVAAVQADQSIAYGELATRARRLAACLREHRVGPDVVVGLHVERGIDMLVAMLGILEAGGAYLPLRVGDPPDRLLYILADSGAEVVVTSSATGHRLAGFTGARVLVDAEPSGTPPRTVRRVTPENLAYVIYTSGTTGTPKGVAVPHRAAARVVRSGVYAEFGPGQTFLQSCPLSFDASVFEIWACLTNGARLALLPDERTSIEAIVETVRRFGVTIAWLTPTVFNELVDSGLLTGLGLRQVVVGGEILSTAHLARAMRSGGPRLSNGYGPTEAGVFTCCHRFEEPDLAYSPPPVGRPLPGTEVRILDADLRPVPDGMPGELYIGGDALAHGYHNRPDLTATAFLPDPADGKPGARLYRSGDIARVLPGGLLQVLGRTDGQVKIRGNRVELAEVESALRHAPDVRQAAVVDREQGTGRVLVAFVVPAPGMPPTVSRLRQRLAQRLPDYMIPSEFFRLDRLPVTRHGKLDRAALRADVLATSLDLGVQFAHAESELEALVAEIWSDVLAVPAVGLDDNYFDLGGTSMSIQAVQQRLQRALGTRLPVTALYEYPTVRRLAEALAEVRR
jgi:amino acid adenylation domain-containing protein